MKIIFCIQSFPANFTGSPTDNRRASSEQEQNFSPYEE
jgi:hypothetical protein